LRERQRRLRVAAESSGREHAARSDQRPAHEYADGLVAAAGRWPTTQAGDTGHRSKGAIERADHAPGGRSHPTRQALAYRIRHRGAARPRRQHARLSVGDNQGAWGTAVEYGLAGGLGWVRRLELVYPVSRAIKAPLQALRLGGRCKHRDLEILGLGIAERAVDEDH
jgi:hypothetical protein